MLGYGSDEALPGEVPVGMGHGNIESRNGEAIPTEENCPYLADMTRLYMGDEIFVEQLHDAKQKSITLVVQSGFASAAVMAVLHGDLLKEKTKRVVIMGGVEQELGRVILKNGLMVPDKANNNTFNWPASVIFYRWCQENNIEMVITSRIATYEAPVPYSFFDQLEATGNPIGASIQKRHKPAIQLLWQRANAPPSGSDEEKALPEHLRRGPLPNDRGREKWFVPHFCGGMDPGIGPEESILPHLRDTYLYDPSSYEAVNPASRDYFFDSVPVRIGDTVHYVIGLEGRRNVRDGEELSHHMQAKIIAGATAGKAALQATGNPLVKGH
jgi:hypothetical protein